MALRQSFEQAPMVGKTDPSAWRLVGSRTEAGVVRDRRLHRESVMRWTNSPAYLDDPGIRAYAETVAATARAQGKTVWQVMREADYGSWDMTPFSRWWQESGRMRHRTESYSAQGVNLGGMRDAVRSANNGTVLLAERGSNAEEIANLLIGKATTVNGRITMSRSDQAVVRMFGPMPSDAVGATGTGAHSITGLPGRIQDKAFDIMYGVPGYNRFGLIHEDFYDQALRTLVKGSEGRILTPQVLVDLRLVDNIEDARIMMNINVERVQQIAREHNLVTTQMIESSADRYARNQALHLMYQPGATSMLGGMFQRYLMPFGPAQYDFMSWWAYQATRAAEVTMFGKSAQIPNIFKGLGAVRAGTAGALPLNLRLLARAGEFAKMQDMSMEAIKANGGGPAEGASVLDRIASLVPTQIVEELTFLPRIDNVDNFLIDFGPSVGPLPAWIIRLAPDPASITDESSLWARVTAGFRSYAETIMPAISWGEESGLNWMSALKAVFPDYEGGARDLLTTTLRTVGKVLTGSGNKVLGDSYMLRDSLDAVLASRFGERTGFLPIDTDSDEYVQWIGDAQTEAESKAWDQDWQNSLTRSLPFGRLLWAPDDMATPMWEGFVGDLDFVVQQGMMGVDIAGNIKTLWQQHLDGSLSDTGIRDLHDSLITALFGLANVPGGDLMQAWLIANNPELVVPMTGRYEVAVDENGLYRGPADARTSDGRPLLLPGIEGFDQLRVGLEAGWYVEKDTKQRIDEMNWRLAQAQRTVLRATFEQLTGKTWPPSNATNAMLRHTYTIGPQLRQSLIVGGVPADMLRDTMTGTELFARGGAISTTAQALSLIPYSRDPSTAISRRMLMDDQWGNRALADLDAMNKAMEERGFQHPSDWPEDALAAVRATFGGPGGAIERELISADEYAREYQRTYGPLEGFTFDPPPAMADLPEGSVIMRAQPDDLFIIDGDTVDLLLGDGSTRRFRLIGVNAPDHPMPGSAEAFDDLYDLLKAEGYTDVALVVWDAARFGITAGTDYSNGQPRYKAWLYVNGQPVYNPAVFTYRNPLGISTGATFVPLPRPGTARETQ